MRHDSDPKKRRWKSRSHVPRYLRLLELLPVIPVEAEMLVRDMQRFGYPGYSGTRLRADLKKSLQEGFLLSTYLLYEPGRSGKPQLFARCHPGTVEQVAQAVLEIEHALQGEATDGPTPVAEASYHAVNEASAA